MILGVISNLFHFPNDYVPFSINLGVMSLFKINLGVMTLYDMKLLVD